MRILVVDDSEVHRTQVGGLLESDDDIELEYAADGRHALEKIDEGDEPPDLIVTDIVMPHVDGLELVSEVRDLHPTLPVVLITSQGSEEIAARALAAGATSYVPKTELASCLPQTVKDLLETVGLRKERSVTDSASALAAA